ncbi:hypothetical protein ABPG74_005950 [Tetrahymena malaccensis]
MNCIAFQIEEYFESKKQISNFFKNQIYAYIVWYTLSVFFYAHQESVGLTIFTIVCHILSNVLIIRGSYILAIIPQIQNFHLNNPNFHKEVMYMTKEGYNYASTLDSIQNNRIQRFAFIFYTFCYIHIQIAVSYANFFCFSADNNEDNHNYFAIFFFFLSVFILVHMNSQLIHFYSFDSRYHNCKIRNFLKYVYIFCSIYTQLKIQQYLPNMLLKILFIVVQGAVQLICSQKYINTMANTQNQQVDKLIRILAVFFFSYVQLEIFVFPIYNKILSEYYNNFCKGFKLYILTLWRISSFFLLLFIFTTENFQKNTSFINKLIITLHLTTNLIFIIYQLLNQVFAKVQLHSLFKIIKNSESNSNQMQMLLGHQELKQKISKELNMKYQLSCIMDQLTIINIDDQIIDQNNEEEDQESSHPINILLSVILNQDYPQHFVVRKDTRDWLAKEENNIYINLNLENADYFIKAFQNYQSKSQINLIVHISEQIPQKLQYELIQALAEQLYLIRVNYQLKSNHQSKVLDRYIKDQQDTIQVSLCQLLAAQKNIFNYLQCNPKIVYYDFYES